jgi:steroid delta-isomerase-like uncharacterized protein
MLRGGEKVAMNRRLATAGLIVSMCWISGCRDRAAMAELAAMKAQAEVEARNRAIVSRWFGEVTRQNFHQMFEEVFAADCIQRMPPDAEPMAAVEFERMVGEFYAAFPEVTHTVDDLIAEGDRVAATVSVRAVHAGEFLGVPATGEELEWTAIAIFRISDGVIRERWEIHDHAGLMEQLGIECGPRE